MEGYLCEGSYVNVVGQRSRLESRSLCQKMSRNMTGGNTIRGVLKSYTVSLLGVFSVRYYSDYEVKSC